MRIHRIDHVSINVNDLSAAKAFFVEFHIKKTGQHSKGEQYDSDTE